MAALTRMSIIIFAVVNLGITLPVVAQDVTAPYKVPHNELGQPDFRGVWNFSSDIPLARDKEYAEQEFLTLDDLAAMNAKRDKMIEQFNNTGTGFHDKYWLDYKSHVVNLRSSLVTYPENGRMPTLVDGVHRINPVFGIGLEHATSRPVRFAVGGIGVDGPEDRGLFERCLAALGVGPPIQPAGDNNYLQIFQTKNHIVLLMEHIHDARIIPVNGQPFANDTIRHWHGDSRGYWQGDTLIVETKNFNDLTQSFDSAGTAYHKVVTERFTRVADNELRYEASFQDPHTFQDRVDILLPMAKFDGQLYEFACHEGNYSMTNTLAGARKEEREKEKE